MGAWFTEPSNQINGIGTDKAKLGKDSFEASVITILNINITIPTFLAT